MIGKNTENKQFTNQNLMITCNPVTLLNRALISSPFSFV